LVAGSRRRRPDPRPRFRLARPRRGEVPLMLRPPSPAGSINVNRIVQARLPFISFRSPEAQAPPRSPSSRPFDHPPGRRLRPGTARYSAWSRRPCARTSLGMAKPSNVVRRGRRATWSADSFQFEGGAFEAGSSGRASCRDRPTVPGNGRPIRDPTAARSRFGTTAEAEATTYQARGCKRGRP